MTIVATATLIIITGLVVLAIQQPSSLTGGQDESTVLPVRATLEIHSPELQQIVNDLSLTKKVKLS